MPSTHNVRRLILPLHSRLQWRPRSSAATAVRQYTEQVIIQCKASGSITLDIHLPPSTSSTTPRPADAASLLIDLSSGIYTSHSLKTPTLQPALLAVSTNLPVVQINYRLSRSHRFPIPLHDILHGYDWIVKNLLPSPPPPPDSFHTPSSTSNTTTPSTSQVQDLPETAHQSLIAVHGTHIGGSLALSLALTECRTPSSLSSLYEHPARIVAVATRDAITDWPLLAPLRVNAAVEPLFAGAGRGDGGMIHSDEELEELRQSLFQDGRMGDYFDPFASPALFFRTAGVELPARNTLSFSSSSSRSSSSSAASCLLSSSSSMDSAMSAQSMESLSPAPSSASTSSPDQDQNRDQEPKHPRFYARRFPPTSMGPTILPSMRLAATPKSIFELQAIEFVKLVHRAMVRQMIPSGAGQRIVDEILEGEEAAEAKNERDEMLRDAREMAKGRAEVVVRDDVGGEDHGEKMEEEAERVGRWFRKSVSEGH